MPNDAGSTKRRPRTGLALAIVLGVVALDVLTKVWAVHELADGPVSIIGDTVDFRLARNTGGALFGLFRESALLFGIVSLGVIALIVGYHARGGRSVYLSITLGLLLGGALGNLIDRVFRAPGFMRGGVIDFVHVSEWPTFNVADSAVTIGAILLVIWAFRADRDERRAGSVETTSDG